MLKLLDTLIPNWMYGKRWLFYLIFAMKMGYILKKINKLEKKSKEFIA